MKIRVYCGMYESKIKCQVFLDHLQGHLEEFRYIKVHGKKSFAVHFNDISLF